MSRLELVIRQEFRILSADRTIWIVCAILLALIGYSLQSGMTRISRQEAVAAEMLDKQAKADAPLMAQLKRIQAGEERPKPFANPADPSNMGSSLGVRTAYMPAAPLAPAAVGQSDLFPDQFKVTYRSKVYFIYDTAIENPWNLLSGNIDLAFVIIYLFPLMIFALNYNLLSAEREQGTLRMLMSQPLNLAALLAGKIAVRASALLGLAVLVPAATLSAARPVLFETLAWWSALVLAYGAFWFACVVFVNAFGKSSAVNAVALIGSWVVLVLIVPVVLNVAVSLAAPVPSRTEMAARTRVITTEVLNRYAHELRVDYQYVAKPEVLVPKDGKIEVPSRMRAFYHMQRDVDAEIQPTIDRFELQLAKQNALARALGILSPAAVAYEGMTALAGTGGRRYAHFMDQVETFHQAWKAFFIPKIDAGTAITAADFDLMPDYTWTEEDAPVVRRHAVQGVLQVLVPAVILIGIGAWRLRRFSAV